MKFIFIGNRSNVFKKMLQISCDLVKIFAVKDSYLENDLKEIGYDYQSIVSKEKLIEDIKKLDFDCLVSNGCPYILPVSKMKKNHQIFINIHPSLLPDLKGKHPINGAILFDRKHGVTCHHMDDGIDTGSIIANIEIPITSDIDLGLLYQLSFIAEGEVFKKAYDNGFEENKIRYTANNLIYYTRKSKDLEITPQDNIDDILKKIRAFGIPSLCARFYKGEKEYKILSAKIIDNPVLDILFCSKKDDEILCCYDSIVLVKLFGKYIQFKMLDLLDIKVGRRFFNFDRIEIKDNGD
jgi:methionyl-tRNA formyltransferase